MLAALQVFYQQAWAVAVDIQRHPHGRELIHQLGELATSGRSVHLPSFTAYDCQKQCNECRRWEMQNGPEWAVSVVIYRGTWHH